MTIDRISVSDLSGVWNVAIWEDAGLDYEDPDLDEQDVLDQMVAEGWFDILYAVPIGWDDDTHVDPDDGTVTTVSATTFIAAGTLTDQTGLVAAHALATITRFEVSNSLGNEQIVVNVGVIETPETVEAALDSAVEIADVVMEASLPPDTPTSPGGGAGTNPGSPSGPIDQDGEGPDYRDPCPECSPCLWATTPDAPPMTDECCACYGTLQGNLADCRSDYHQDLGVCALTAGAQIAGKAIGCSLVCGAVTGIPVSLPICLGCLGLGLGHIVRQVVLCMLEAKRNYENCVALQQQLFNLCLAANNCN